jgi:hypothetical protein
MEVEDTAEEILQAHAKTGRIFAVYPFFAPPNQRSLLLHIGHILHRNCLLKEVIEGKIQGQKEVTRRRGRRRKKLLDDLGDEEATLI